MAAGMGGFYAFQVRRLLTLGFRRQIQNLWKVGAAGAVMVIAVYWLRTQLVGQEIPDFLEMVVVAGFGAISYGATLLALGLRVKLGGGRFELFDAH